MEKLIITGVPEHFNFPWLQVVKDQPFQGEKVQLVWEDEPKGSGAMNQSIRNGKTDIAIILTESFIRDKIEGNPGKILGYHVITPLVWGIHVASKTNIMAVEELENCPFLISKKGSGSHLMAYLLAQKQGWDLENLEFEIIGNLEGAVKAFKNSSPKGFLWEKYTTKPLVDNGQFRRIGEIPSPWPCFVIVASEMAVQKFPQTIKKLQELVYQKSSALMKNKGLSTLISSHYQIREADIKEWANQTEWAISSKIQANTLLSTMEILQELKLIPKAIDLDLLVDGNYAELV